MATLLNPITKRSFLCLVAMLIGIAPVFAQDETPDAPDPDKIYRDLEEALKTPDQVFHLSLKKKKLMAFPVELISLKNLKTLDLSKNKLLEIPALIGELTALEELNLTGNKLITLPSEIGKLTQLKTLHVGMNELEYLPTEIGLLAQLEILDIWNNNLEALPVSVSDLTQLKSVDMRVIQLNQDEKRSIRELFPESVEIRFSNSCDCD